MKHIRKLPTKQAAKFAAKQPSCIFAGWQCGETPRKIEQNGLPLPFLSLWSIKTAGREVKAFYRQISEGGKA